MRGAKAVTAAAVVRPRRSRRRRQKRIKALEEPTPMTKEEERLLRELLSYRKPRTRGECMNRKRPCLFVSCKHHLYLDVNPETGSIKFNFPDREVWELEETCALDVADRGGVTLEEVGAILNLTRERIRQVEVKGLSKLKHQSRRDVLVDFE